MSSDLSPTSACLLILLFNDLNLLLHIARFNVCNVRKGESFICSGVVRIELNTCTFLFWLGNVFIGSIYFKADTCILWHTCVPENRLKLAHIHSAVLPCLWYTWPSFIVFFPCFTNRRVVCSRLQRYIEYMCIRHTLKVIDEAERKNVESPPVPTHLSRATLICPGLCALTQLDQEKSNRN